MFGIAVAASMASTYFISSEKIDEIILNKSQVQAEFLADNAGYILENSDTPVQDLQKLVGELKQRADVTYAIVIDSNVSAIAHSDKSKLNKVYKDSYTVKGATQGEQQYSKWYADLQQVWVFDIMAPIYVNGELYGTFDIGIPITEVSQATNGIISYQLASMVFIFVVCLVVLSLLLSKLMRPLLVLKNTLHDISKGDGDLSVRLPIKGNDEVAQISSAFNVFVGKVHEIITQTVNTGVELNSTAISLREQSQQALQRGQEQNEQTMLVVTSMNEMIATVNEIASSAAGAANAANLAASETQGGHKTIEKTTTSIANLEAEMNSASNIIVSLADNTQSIGTILDVIRGISEQTNLLALNAAIEAARAGEAGRGFAVVADEVRNLATKTAQSTDEIDTMINQLQTEAKNAVSSMSNSKSLIEEGTVETEMARRALEKISTQVLSILDINTQVATATEQQSAVANEINMNMDTVNNLVKNGLSASEKLEQSSKQLAGLSQVLERYVGSFKI
ncbi:methyl-accepting chemotaxis protein [Vibrio sp. Isolate31]|uniref:methyl-accepting chemotaxis protein n=1 Tax=unclassified Vibrio TaxID=2614977 RepID=UPI001EFDA9B0|nr:MULTISPECIES: methyl-accepting chemotaxis protein [unclassified Vibrio]MCG9553595.1 methyl-accepting chemotaxis protein [Vibrio sp. Isolate32]MCG9601974.1 methyl-accepting chemotaxis protein [Vibrio sp. Isolate31]